MKLDKYRLELLVDRRWQGNTGIGRYSRELIPYLSALVGGYLDEGNPVSIKELIKGFFSGRGFDNFYSPGYVPIYGMNRQLITIHDLILLERGIGRIHQKIYFNLYLRNLLRFGKIRVITVSHSSRERISNWARIPLNQIEVISNGISESILKAGENLDFLPRGRTLMFVGSLKPHKRFDLFVDAINLLEEHCCIILVGPNINRHTISDRHTVRHLQNVSDEVLAKCYLETDVVVVTSIHEGFCMPVLEGSYLGCKIVDLGVLPTVKEIIGNSSFSTNGSLEAKTIAREIERALLAPRKLLEIDRQLLADRYNWEKSRENLKKLVLLLQVEQ